MEKNKRNSIVLLLVLSVAFVLIFVKQFYLTNNKIEIYYPWENALFPADMAAPTFRWNSESEENLKWLLVFKQGNNHLYQKELNTNNWRPEKAIWDSIRAASNYNKITLRITKAEDSNSIYKQSAEVSFGISSDSVDAPILYREIPLPFAFAELNMELTGYSLMNVASYSGPHEVLERFPVCGNCHSLTADGNTIALDFDASTRDKGGYFIADIDTVTVFNRHNYMSWSKYQKESTFGLFSRISGDGRYVVTTIKDRVVSKVVQWETAEDIAYSQVFFPVNGVLAVYDRVDKTFRELSGADDLEFVQSNPIWTPDDKHIIFTKARAIPYPDSNSKYESFYDEEEVIEEYIAGQRKMKYDLYIIPFNDGEGGEAIPVKGASINNRSNYFPAISPDGKWVAYCQADNLMMLRPDSRLHMVSLETGKSKELRCNFPSMNSWHAWSPNGKWMVYSSKFLSMYTDLFLTHIDEKGNSSVPILIENAHKPDRAVNYPEFVNSSPDYLWEMEYNYVNIQHIVDVIVKKQDTLTGRRLLSTYLNQSEISLPEEYQGLSLIYELLGDKAQSDYYAGLSREIEKEYYKTGDLAD